MKTRDQYRHQIVDDSTAAGINTVGLGELLDLAASLKHELEDLQSTVDSEGITYTTSEPRRQHNGARTSSPQVPPGDAPTMVCRAQGVGIDRKGEEGLMRWAWRSTIPISVVLQEWAHYGPIATGCKTRKAAVIAAFLLLCLCPERDSNPHALTDTWPSTMPVYQFQHLGWSPPWGSNPGPSH